MAFHNPFIKDGQIRFPDNGSLVRHVETVGEGARRQARLPVPRLLHRTRRRARGSDTGPTSASRNRAVGARLQQVTEPGDRVAILCPQNLEYLVAFFGTLYSGRIAVPLFDPGRARPRRPAARGARRLPPVGDPDHHRLRRGRAQVLPQPARQGAAPRHRRRRGARRGRRHLGAGRRRAATPSPTCSTPRARPASRPACRSPT